MFLNCFYLNLSKILILMEVITKKTKNLIKGHENLALNDKERLKLIKKGAKQFGKFLTSLGYDWQNDPHMKDTPMRYTKAWVNELFVGNFKNEPNITSFFEENLEMKYDGIIIEKDVEIISKCSHHLETFKGVAHIAYMPNELGAVIGLSKLNRIADFCARRPQVQERLTKQIHDKISYYIPDNKGVAVFVSCKHQCCSNRGIGHDSTMDTIYISGVFRDIPSIKEEFLFSIGLQRK